MADFPESPCASCPRVEAGLPLPCRAMTSKHSRYCQFAAEGHAGYIRYLKQSHVPSARPAPPASHDEIMARRAGKLRLPLGVKAPTPPPGRR